MRTAWAVFTRAARPGEVKTRLAAVHGPHAALLVHRWLLRRTLAAVEQAPGERSLWIVPEADPWTQRLARGRGWPIRLQEGADLGARMAHAARSLLATHEAVVLVGGDLPRLGTETLRHLADALVAGHRVVFVPAFDGGYGAVGLSAPPPGILDALFAAHAWGSSDVLRASRLALRARGCDPYLLPPTPDWDRPEDLAGFAPFLPPPLLRRLAKEIPGGRALASSSRMEGSATVEEEA